MSFEQQLVIRYEFHVLNFKIYHEILHFLSKTYTMPEWQLSFRIYDRYRHQLIFQRIFHSLSTVYQLNLPQLLSKQNLI